LGNAAPCCSFLVSSAERRVYGEGASLLLRGLEPEAALALVERALQRTLSDEERVRALDVCRALAGHPLRILQIATLVREIGTPASWVGGELPGSPIAAERVADAVPASLEPAERAVVGLLAAVAPASLSVEAITAITRAVDAEQTLASLEGRGLAERNSP